MRNKKGFSIAELLIAISIIAIISTMGFIIARRGIESSYNQYYYTGYKGISEALAEAYSSNPLQSGPITEAFKNDLVSLLRAVNITFVNGNLIFNTPNGLNYDIIYNGDYSTNVNNVNKSYHSYYIRMILPKKSDKNGNQAEFVYLPDLYNGILIPVLSDGSSVDLANRKDLLPVCIDNGRSGHLISTFSSANEALHATSNNAASNANNFEKMNIISYKQAFCQKYGELKIENGVEIQNVVTCNGISKTNPSGYIKVLNPKKVY